jgi:flagellar hook-associated protein 1
VSGTFSSLSNALSALRYNRVAMDVASGNVANAGTAGYARRAAVAQATGAPAELALWSRWEGAGDGVQVGGIDRMVDPLLDARARSEHAARSFLDARATSLVRFETTIGEPGDGGVAAALAAFKQGWHDVANNPGDGAARSQLLGRAETLRSTIAAQGRAVSTEWSDQRTRLTAVATETNELAAGLAKINEGLRISHVSGTDAGVLLDQRDQLTLRLAELTGATVTVNEDTTVDVRVEGQVLVAGNAATPVTVSGSADLAGAGTDPVRVSVGGTAVTLRGGELGAAQDLLTGALPDYLTRLDAVVADLAAAVNAQHGQGADLDGAAGTAFFTGSTAATLQVAVTDPRAVAAADPAKGTLDGSNADLLGTLDLAAGAYRSLVTDFGVAVSSARRVAENQTILTAQVDASREALSGINVDEEMVNLLAAQRAYEGAARVLTTLDSVLDTLINRTGLMR